jgi:hypothetical protein
MGLCGGDKMRKEALNLEHVLGILRNRKNESIKRLNGITIALPTLNPLPNHSFLVLFLRFLAHYA